MKSLQKFALGTPGVLAALAGCYYIALIYIQPAALQQGVAANIATAYFAFALLTAVVYGFTVVREKFDELRSEIKDQK